jgi:Type IV secretion-system coupling protein DNA-binding domain/TraM recognition site of TraD and TraG
MTRLDEELSARFHRWEERARGWQVHPQPVAPEPPFTSFRSRDFSEKPVIDDGRRPGLLSSLMRSFTEKKTTSATLAAAEEEPEPQILERDGIVELRLNLPPSFAARPPEFSQFLASLAHLAEPLGFELVGTPAFITAQLAVSATDETRVKQQIRAFFPEVVCTSSIKGLEAALGTAGEGEIAVVEFGLAREAMLSLAGVEHDLCVPLVGAMSELAEGEFALYQVLFQPAVNPWAENLTRAVTDESGDAFFVNGKDLVSATKQKTARPLFGVVARVAVCAREFGRVREIARSLAGTLSAFADPNGNELIPLRNHDYPLEAHVEDMLRRQSRRSGMLLNIDELIGFVRFPTDAVLTPKLRRQTQRTKAAPAIATTAEGLVLGTNTHAGETRTVALTPEQRVRHTHIIGASGTGKSTLLFNLIRQDIETGQGVGILDPHGDLIEKILGIIPESRVADVVLLDPANEEFVIGFNILSAHSDWEKNLLASDLVSVFRRLSTSWGDQMGSVLANAVRAFLESERGGTLADMQRFLLEPAFREQFLTTVRDPGVVYYWRKGFPMLAGNKSIGPILTRLDTFLGPKPIRYMVSQADNRLNFGDIMDSGKIFLARLSQGAIGNENAYLLGSLLVTKFHQLAMSRQRQQEAARRDFWLYLDEFQNFITPSMAEILTGARKYRIGLTLAHQELRQLQRDPEVASAVLSISGTRICFRVGDQDARALESGFSSFEAHDLQNLSTGEAICRIERSDYDFNISVTLPEYPDAQTATSRRQDVITASRKKYATHRAEVEAAISASPPSAPLAASTTATEQVRPQAAKPAGPTGATEASPSVAPALPAQIKPIPSRIREEKTVSPTTELGKGGEQHRAIQTRIREAATALGFRVLVEKQVPSGSIDLVIEREDTALACEITVMNTIDYEVGNVAKCVNAGFERVAVIGVDENKLAKLQSAVSVSLGPATASRVSFFLPDAFLVWLRDLPAIATPVPNETIVGGRKVKTTFVRLSPEETKAREDGLIKVMVEAMKKPKRGTAAK